MTETRLPPVTGPAPPPPPRAPFSIRRTTTIDTHWPDGQQTAMVQHGHARDLLTLADVGLPRTLAEDHFTARISWTREILEIASDPPRAGTEGLVGARAGGQLRAAIAQALPAERAAGTPLYLLLDDIAGSSLVAGWAWSQWLPDWERTMLDSPEAQERRKSMVGVCIGFRPGSAALVEDGPRPGQNVMPVGPIDAGDDPHAWHELTPQQGAAARRARRIDVQLGDQITVTAHFQDSATSPSGQRMAIHEYLVTATADRETKTLLSIQADPRILPYQDACPAAILNIGRLVGTPLGSLRQAVLTEFARTEGCTHLNDMMRSLAEVPQLVAALAEATGETV
ncbi:hypothetical protein BH10PSE13_BH10PSE13_19960 [soil metagenome]